MTDSVSKRQKRLAALLRTTSGSFRAEDAARALGLDRAHAAKLLAGWHKQGVVRRVARGLYVPVQPSALGQTQVLDDPWVLVPELYTPGYVGGWSALEHWELTEQLFRSVCVLTAKRTKYGETQHQGVPFFVKHIPETKLFGTKTLWRKNIKVLISDPHKTILDIVDDPYLGAGLQHTVDCLRVGAPTRREGNSAEMLDFDASFVQDCSKNMTMGYAYLDKSARDQKLVTRWRLWAPKGYEF